MKIADFAATDGVVEAARELANAAPISNLGEMAAVGSRGNTTGMLLAASVLSLNEDVKLAFHSIDSAKQLALGEVYFEAGYMRVLRQKWEKEMKEVQNENAELKSQVSTLQRQISTQKAQLSTIQEEVSMLQGLVANLQQQMSVVLVSFHF
jgi:peptidoglycan hydrolase CwlO-like protein